MAVCINLSPTEKQISEQTLLKEAKRGIQLKLLGKRYLNRNFPTLVRIPSIFRRKKSSLFGFQIVSIILGTLLGNGEEEDRNEERKEGMLNLYSFSYFVFIPGSFLTVIK